MVDLKRYIHRGSMIRLDEAPQGEVQSRLLRHCLRDYPEAERERLMATLSAPGMMKDQAIGQGFSITHARLDEIEAIHLAVGLLPPGPRRHGAWAHTVFCTVIPAGRSAEYLGFMARLCRMLSGPGTEEVFSSGDVGRIEEYVTRFEA